jgi:hypothetical protein
MAHEQIHRIPISLFFFRPWLIEKFMQRGITPLDVVCPGQLFQSSKIFFGQAVAGFLIVRITEEDPTSEGARLAGSAQLVLLEGTKVGRDRGLVRRGVGQQHVGFQVADKENMPIFLEPAAAPASDTHGTGSGDRLIYLTIKFDHLAAKIRVHV